MSKTSLGSHKYKFIETKESVYAREYSRKFGEVQNQNVFWTCLSVPNTKNNLNRILLSI